MRIFIYLLFLFTSVLSAAEAGYCIQVLSVKEQASITDAFMDKIKAIPIVYTQKKENEHYTICVGGYKTYVEASSELATIREQIHPDAFIVRVEDETVLQPQQKMQQAMLMAQARTLLKMKKEEVEVSETELETVEPIKVAELQEKIVIEKIETKTVAAMGEDVKTEKIYCKPSKKMLRESEISDALAFYRQSSFYTFTN